MWHWYKVFNINEFWKKNVPDYFFTADLENIGEQTIGICAGFTLSVWFMGYWIVPKLNGRNGFEVRDKVSAYIDAENNLWVGYNDSTL